MSRRLLALLLAPLIIAVGLVAYSQGQRTNANLEPIRVGVLHSLTGTMAISEQPVVEATLLAIEEINDAGGINGRRIVPIVVDGASDWGTFAREAERLITQEKVEVVFGCWTSASRKTVRPVFERHDHLLFYPVQYEGIEQSPNIIYTGAAPNQQIVPAVSWAIDRLGARRFFLVGSDYVFPRSANAIIRDFVTALGGEIVGEEYVLLGSEDVQGAVDAIVRAKPDVILNTINGDSNIPFFAALRAAGITPELSPTISFSIAEPELQSLDTAAMVGDFAAWNYFMVVETAENRQFVRAFQDRYGRERVVSDPLEAAYFGVKLWARAVGEAGESSPVAVRKAIGDLSLDAPEGRVYIDAETQHSWKTVRIGRIRPDAQFEIVWTSDRPVRPVPYPRTRTREQWHQFLAELQAGWNGAWAAPATSEN
jgi:urea transport system substrate-binding protein